MKQAGIALAFLAVLVFSLTGCGKQEQAAGPIKIGAVFSVTGPAAKLGGPEKNAALMVVEQLNAAGGINGRPVELIIEDDQGVEENTVNALRKLIDSDNVVAIIGPTRSGNGIAAARICEEDSVPLVSCAAAWIQLFPGNDVNQPMYRYVFKTPQNDSDCAVRILEDCKAKGYTKVAIISGSDSFGQAGRDEVLRQAPNYGVTMVSDETYPPDASDLTPILTKVKTRNPQAIINWSIVPAQGLIAAQVKQLGITAQIYQSHGFGNKGYITAEAEKTLFPAGRLLVTGDIDSSHPQYSVLTKFKTDYEAKYGEEVSTFAGHAYDALGLLVEAIKAKGTERAAIRDGLEQITGFVGTAGVFTMLPNDHCGLKSDAFAMIMVKDGQFRLAEKAQ
jgi:branched-chain amino acid transport system substrate-binding protein